MGSVFQLPNKLKTSWQHLRSKHWHQIDHILADPQTRSHISKHILMLSATQTINLLSVNVCFEKVKEMLHQD